MKKKRTQKVNERKMKKVLQHTKKKCRTDVRRSPSGKNIHCRFKVLSTVDNDSIHDLIKLHNRISSRYPATVSC